MTRSVAIDADALAAAAPVLPAVAGLHSGRLYEVLPTGASRIRVRPDEITLR